MRDAMGIGTAVRHDVDDLVQVGADSASVPAAHAPTNLTVIKTRSKNSGMPLEVPS